MARTQDFHSCNTVSITVPTTHVDAGKTDVSCKTTVLSCCRWHARELAKWVRVPSTYQITTRGSETDICLWKRRHRNHQRLITSGYWLRLPDPLQNRLIFRYCGVTGVVPALSHKQVDGGSIPPPARAHKHHTSTRLCLGNAKMIIKDEKFLLIQKLSISLQKVLKSSLI